MLPVPAILLPSAKLRNSAGKIAVDSETLRAELLTGSKPLRMF